MDSRTRAVMVRAALGALGIRLGGNSDRTVRRANYIAGLRRLAANPLFSPNYRLGLEELAQRLESRLKLASSSNKPAHGKPFLKLDVEVRGYTLLNDAFCKKLVPFCKRYPWKFLVESLPEFFEQERAARFKSAVNWAENLYASACSQNLQCPEPDYLRTFWKDVCNGIPPR